MKNTWNSDLVSNGYKTVEEYVELWNEGGKDKVDFDRSNSGLDLMAFLSKNKKALSKQMKSFVYTIHKPFLYYKDIDELLMIIERWKGVDKSMYSIEVGKEGKTLHIQGYIKMKSSTTKAQIIKRFNCVDTHIEVSKGTQLANYTYISKDEGVKGISKIIRYTGNWNKGRMERRDYNVSDFVDYAIDTKMRLISSNFDKYCAPFRLNPQATLPKIRDLYAIRSPKPIKNKPTFTLTGSSGAGKSMLSWWLLKQAGILEEEVFKLEANAHSKKLWFTSQASIQPIAFFSEVNAYFPNKTNLLSLVDGESRLEVKGKDSIKNNFDLIMLNTTNLTPYYIYNLTQHDETSYIEVARRLSNGSQYVILPNPSWPNGKPEDNLSPLEILEQCPPIIYKLDTTTYPPFVDSLTMKTRDHAKRNLFSFEKGEMIEKYFNTSLIFSNQELTGEFKWPAKVITKEELLADLQKYVIMK